ncbi:hypothetical protein V497_04928 [Pseudogymnoascus sp. VKM F-4516 (FW-969)]|nr:hypothetical protein V497_04928 [Pseudogymnoascus sp. VKM F-4516 (FW-969)]
MLRAGKVCDVCSIRKVRCDRKHPCGRCVGSSLKCTFFKARAKPGPKGPRRSTAKAIQNLQSEQVSLPPSEEPHFNISLSATEFEGVRSQSPHEVYQHQEADVEDLNWTQDYMTSGSSTIQSSVPTAIPFSSITHYLAIYASQGYSIWPVVGVEDVISRLLADGDDMEAYALATSVCAATITQFQITNENTIVNGTQPITAAAFEGEAKRALGCYDYKERMTIWSLLCPFFLNVYTANIGKLSTSTVLLKEAITFAHIIGLHKKEYYKGLGEDVQQHCLRVYWLLFITDRAHSLQHDVPTTLQRAHGLPALYNRSDGSVSLTFLHLCTLFTLLDETVNVNLPHHPTRTALAKAQNRLKKILISASDSENEVQLADVSMTQQWMRVALWQYSLSVTDFRSDGDDEEFTFSFPVQVARNALNSLSNLSQQSLEAHGPGMEIKLFDIANSLADVMICVPSLASDNQAGFGLRDIFFALTTLLKTFRGGNSTLQAILKDKLAQSGLIVASPPQVVTDVTAEDDDLDDEPPRCEIDRRHGTTGELL